MLSREPGLVRLLPCMLCCALLRMLRRATPVAAAAGCCIASPLPLPPVLTPSTALQLYSKIRREIVAKEQQAYDARQAGGLFKPIERGKLEVRGALGCHEPCARWKGRPPAQAAVRRRRSTLRAHPCRAVPSSPSPLPLNRPRSESLFGTASAGTLSAAASDHALSRLSSTAASELSAL